MPMGILSYLLLVFIPFLGVAGPSKDMFPEALVFMLAKATTLVTLVLDENATIYDIPPAFEQSLYRFEIEENQPSGRIGKLEAHHRAVELGKDRLWYVLDRNTKDSSLFRIESETGWLINRQPLDAELKRIYNLKLSACLETNTSSCARSEAIIVVTDTNDNTPEFNHSSFEITIPLNLPIGSELVRVAATDADTGKNGEISYSLRTSYAFQTLFEIDLKTGAITLAKRLNGDSGGRVEPGTVYRIEVDATDHGEPPMSSSTSVKITTADINPSSPEFDQFRYEVLFNASSIPKNTFIIQVHATDPDRDMDGKVVYRFADADDQATNSKAEKVIKNYSIDTQTGKITSIANITPEPTAFDEEDQEQDHDHYSLTHLLVVEAIDQSAQFARRSQTVVVIKINSPVQMEQTEKRVEFNPLPKTVFISSAKPLNSNILRVSAKVLDAKKNSVNSSLQSSIVYSVVGDGENKADHYFNVINDQLTVSKSLMPNEYDIKIKADVRGLHAAYHSMHIVVMNDRDKYPVFERISYEMHVDEKAQFPVKMAALNGSVTNGRIAYSILSPKYNKEIDVDKITGQLTLFKQPSTETFVVVRAVNIDHPNFFSDVGVTLTINKLKEKSLSALSFDSKLYRLIAKEGQAAGSVINTIAISMLNPDHLSVQYKFEPESADFGILPNGSVVVKRRLEAHRIDKLDENGVVELKVVAQSREQEATTARSTVQIAIEKMPPVHSPPVFDRPEYVFHLNTPFQTGNFIGQIKAEPARKEEPVIYRVVSGTAQPYFQLNRNDGTIVKSSFKQLESGKTYELVVEAADSEGITASTMVKFIVNYSATTFTVKPAFKVHELGVKTWKLEGDKPHFTIGEDLPPDAKWEFRIASGNQLAHFHLNKLNDHLAQLELVDSQSPLNMSGSERQVIKVEAVNQDDPTETARADVMVDLNHLTGALTSATVSTTTSKRIGSSRSTTAVPSPVSKPLIKFLDISSNPQGIIPINEVNLAQAGQWNPPQPIYRVVASAGGDTPVKYSIAENIPDQLFRINADTGNLYLNDITRKKDVKEEEFELLVKAEAGGNFAQRFYTVKVMVGSPTKPPTLTTSFSTEKSSLSSKFTITATSPKEDGQSTTIAKSLEQSSEKNETSTPAAQRPSIPRFELPNYHFVVSQPVKGTLIGQLKVVKGAAREVLLNIEPALFQNWFSIDSRTSSLYVRDVPTDRFDKQRAEFHVSIQNVDNADLKSKSYVKVDLILPPPSSTPSLQSSSVAVTEATISSASHNEEEPTFFPFLDQLSQSSLPPTFTPAQSKSTTTSITIDTSSSSSSTTPNIQSDSPQTTNFPPNDFSFPHQHYTAMLPEGRYGSRGALVSLRPQALKQGMPNGLSYIIHSPDQPQLPFYVHNETGELIAFAEIDRETAPEYHFQVVAINEKSRQATTDVTINILDVNDNYPVFEPTTAHVLAVDRLTPAGQVLTKFTARDADEGRLGQVSFRMEEDADGLFQVGKTGELVLAKNIPLEQEDVFHIMVAAVDGGRPALKTTHKVRIEVFADSLGKPTFKQTNYTADKIILDHSVSKTPFSSEKGTFVTQVVAGTTIFNYNLVPVNDRSLPSSPSGLFQIEKSTGIVRLARKPSVGELKRQYTLNVTATGEDGATATTLVSVFVEGENTMESTPKPEVSSPEQAVVPASNPEGCSFTSKAFHGEIKENVEGKHKLTKVTSSGCRAGMKAFYTIHQGTAEFSVDANNGEFFVLSALDREKRSLHFIVVNVTEVAENEEAPSIHAQPAKRQMLTGVNPIVEYTKSKLQEGQALVVVRVIDENDNSPQFARLTPDGLYVFPVDWQVNVLQAVARVQAFDPDEKSNLTYTFTHSLADEFFALNKTNGVITVIKSLLDIADEVFNLEVAVSDGTNEARAPVKLYKLQPGTNIVIVESEQSVDKIDELQIVRQLSASLDLDVRVLVKQVFIGEDGHANTTKSHLLVYALDKLSKVPVDAAILKSMLDDQLPKLKKLTAGSKGGEMIQHLSNVKAPFNGSQLHLSFAEFLLLAVSALLLLMACCLLFLLLRCCKRRQMLTKTDLEYMVDSESAGPRPYNVDLITRKMAQSILSARPLPNPREEVTMTPESRATMVRHSSSGSTYPTNSNRDGSSAFSFIDNRRDGTHHNLTYDSSSSESLNQRPNPANRPAPPVQ